MAGIPALVGAALMTLIRCIRDERVDACDKQQTEDQFHKLLNKPAWTEGNSKYFAQPEMKILILYGRKKNKFNNFLQNNLNRSNWNFFTDITTDIMEKNCNNHTFQKTNGIHPKAVLTPETTGINPNSPLLYGFRLSQFLTEEAYMSNDNISIPPKRRYTYSVF